MCAIWNGAKSHAFTTINGVRQGGVLLPLLFNVYFNEKIHKLVNSGIGFNRHTLHRCFSLC